MAYSQLKMASLCAGLAACAASAAFAGNTYYAAPDGSPDADCTQSSPGTIQAAVNKTAAANSWEDGDVVMLAPGVYDFSAETGSALSGLSGSNCVKVAWKSYVTIRSSGGRDATVLRGGGHDATVSEDLSTTNYPPPVRALGVNCPVRVEGVTFADFYATSAGVAAASQNFGQLRLEDCLVAGNYGRDGSALFNAVASGCIFTANTNAAGVGGAMRDGYADHCAFVDNCAGEGGALFRVGATDCAFTNNVALADGGAYSCERNNWHPVLTNCVFVGNAALNGHGGAVRYSDAVGCTFENNSAKGFGGAVCNMWNAFRLDNCTFVGNHSSGDGGAVRECGLGVWDCVFVSNTSDGSGGAVGYSSCQGCHFTNNAAAGSGGGVVGNRYGVKHSLRDCVFVGNRAGGSSGNSDGGGAGYRVYAYDCTFIGNSATNGLGGALNSFAHDAFPSNCTFVGNVAKSGGAFAGWSVRIWDCVFVDNVATAGAGGAMTKTPATGCYFTNNVAATEGGAVLSGGRYEPYLCFTNCVFVGNRCGGGYGGGAINYGQVVNCLFAGNVATNAAGTASGGALCNRLAASFCVVTNCTFLDNEADFGGAVAYSTPVGCLLQGNYARKTGGGVLSDSNHNNSASNCVFLRNAATNAGIGSGVALDGCLAVSNETFGAANALVLNAECRNCTFVDNAANGASVTKGASVNCLFFGNTPADIGGGTHENALFGTTSGSPTLMDCIQTDNPRFNHGRDPAAAWYAPRAISAARDGGKERGYPANALDLAGNGRLNGPIDIGCYEYWRGDFATLLLLR